MSRHIVYRCDECGEVLSDGFSGIEEKHLSINFGPYCGWVEPINNGWKHINSLIPTIYHFCDHQCL